MHAGTDDTASTDSPGRAGVTPGCSPTAAASGTLDGVLPALEGQPPRPLPALPALPAWSGAGGPTVEQGANLLELPSHGTSRRREAAAAIADGRGGLRLDTLRRLAVLLEERRPAVRARAALDRLERDLLLAGAEVAGGRTGDAAGKELAAGLRLVRVAS